MKASSQAGEAANAVSRSASLKTASPIMPSVALRKASRRLMPAGSCGWGLSGISEGSGVAAGEKFTDPAAVDRRDVAACLAGEGGGDAGGFPKRHRCDGDA